MRSSLPELTVPHYIRYPIASRDEADPHACVIVEVVETSATPGGVSQKAGLQPRELVRQAEESLTDALKVIQHTANEIVTALQKTTPTPKAMEVEFGVKAVAELKAFVVAMAGGEATFTVRMTWEPKSPS